MIDAETNNKLANLTIAIVLVAIVACTALGLSLGLLDKVTTIETAIIRE